MRDPGRSRRLKLCNRLQDIGQRQPDKPLPSTSVHRPQISCRPGELPRLSTAVMPAASAFPSRRACTGQHPPICLCRLPGGVKSSCRARAQPAPARACATNTFQGSERDEVTEGGTSQQLPHHQAEAGGAQQPQQGQQEEQQVVQEHNN